MSSLLPAGFHDVKKQNEWSEYFDVLEKELSHARMLDHVYWKFNKEILPNSPNQEKVNVDNVFYDLLEWGYIYKVVMAIRKLIDKRDDSYSLRKLLEGLRAYVEPQYQNLIDKDLVELDKQAQSCRQYANKILAHLSKLPANDVLFEEVRKTLDIVWDMFKKYYTLYSGNGLADKIIITYDWEDIFYYAWKKK